VIKTILIVDDATAAAADDDDEFPHKLISNGNQKPVFGTTDHKVTARSFHSQTNHS
jgi:hypothetical protein